MKKWIIFAIAITLLLAVIGCNPIGMEDTRLYVTGFIFIDSICTIPAEGIGVITTGTQESYVVVTDAQGEFWIEIQLYGEEEESGTKSGNTSTPGSATFGVKAINGDEEYIYGGENGTFTVFGGDTLSLYSVDLGSFAKPDGGS